MSKKSYIELVNLVDGGSRSFEITHAERILRMANNGGWELKDVETYKFTVKNGIEYRRASKEDKREQKERNNKQGDRASESN